MSSSGNRPTHGFNVAQQDSGHGQTPSANSRQAMHASTVQVSASTSTPSSSSKSSKQKQKIVESGREHTGRWTREEHEAFLLALQQYGKEWKKVAAKVKTRTVVQTRTHAQKYFQKLQKGLANEKGDVEMGTVAEAKKILPIASARRGQGAGQSPYVKKGRKKQERSLLATAMSTQKRQAAAATQAAAQLMTQMSQMNTMNEDQSMVSPAGAAPHGAAVPQIGTIYHQTHAPSATTAIYPMGTTFATPVSSGNIVIGPHGQQTHLHHPHNGQPLQQPQQHFTQIKIVAPMPEHTMKKNMFPEPSPAACGKRKAIELAAAQMLAGVASGGNGMPHSGDMARRPTPPPDIRNNGLSGTQLKNDFAAAVNAGPVAMVTGSSANVSLQIINPENLQTTQRKRNLGHDPVTPWDGELEALTSEVKSQEKDEQPKVGSVIVPSEEEKGLPSSMSKDIERSTLHLAVCQGMFEEAKSIIMHHQSNGREEIQKLLSAVDPLGFNCMHSAVTLPNVGNMSQNMTRMLISAGATVLSTDSHGNTPLHWAARVGNVGVMELLVLENCPLDVRNEIGETALHWAMRAGKKGMDAAKFLLKNGSRSSLFNKAFQRPLDVAAEGFSGMHDDKFPTALPEMENENQSRIGQQLVEVKRLSRANLFSFSPQARTLILHHPECLEHLPKYDTDWEAPDRVNAILKTLLERNNRYVRDYEIQVSTEFDRASLEFLSRVHSAEYLTFVNNLSKELEKRHLAEQAAKEKNVPSVVPFTPMVQSTVMRETIVKKGTHSDTSFSSGSLRAARRAAGAVKHAVDCVLVGRSRNAFCITRPPGHHAGINGLLDGAESCGFCIFNNVAAGAMHALSESDENHRPKCERCAIVDIDVHHGNGTEEIVKKCDHPGRLFFFSVHLYDNDSKKGKQNGFKFYPGTGNDDDVAHNVINVPIAPMWKNANRRPRSHSPMPENHHNTRNKSKQKLAATAAASEIAEETLSEKSASLSSSQHEKDSERESQPSLSSQTSSRDSKRQIQPSFLYGTGREAYRQAIQQRLLPALRAFNPDLILLSIGLDACSGDVGNARHYRNGRQVQGIDLTPGDYAWTTRKIMEVADICCQGRVVSVLEGGYGRPSEENTESNLLDKTMISECAMKHLQALIDPHDVELRHSC